MNWKDEALHKLRTYGAMRQAVINIPEELERLEQEAQSIRSVQFDSPTVRSGGQKWENAMINNLVQRQELAQNFSQAQSLVRTTDRAMKALTPEEKLVLQRLYIFPERGGLNRLCEELGVEQSSVYRKRDKALQRFTMAYYGTDS